MVQEAERLSLSTCAQDWEMTLPCPGGQGGAACVRIRRCLPCGQKRCRAARRIWVYRGKSSSTSALRIRGALSARRGTRSPSPASPAAAFSPCRPAGRTAGSARTRPRDPSLGNPFLGDGGHPSISSPIPQTPQAASPCSWACRRLPPSPPHAERNEAPMPPTRGAWVRLHSAEGTGWRHCRPRGRR